jgi:hypothetical protein
MDNLRFIRETMERSTSFTAVSGWAGVAMGVLAVAAGAVARSVTTPLAWIGVWVAVAVVSSAVALVAMDRKARAAGTSLLNGAGRKFVWSFAPPLGVGAVLTVALYRAGAAPLLPAIWLLLYGTAVVTGGQVSVRTVPLTGAVFMALGAAAAFSPTTWGDTYMVAGFGCVHIVSGLIIARRHGG